MQADLCAFFGPGGFPDVEQRYLDLVPLPIGLFPVLIDVDVARAIVEEQRGC